jgi:hypothetical protein
MSCESLFLVLSSEQLSGGAPCGVEDRSPKRSPAQKFLAMLQQIEGHRTNLRTSEGTALSLLVTADVEANVVGVVVRDSGHDPCEVGLGRHAGHLVSVSTNSVRRWYFSSVVWPSHSPS